MRHKKSQPHTGWLFGFSGNCRDVGAGLAPALRSFHGFDLVVGQSMKIMHRTVIDIGLTGFVEDVPWLGRKVGDGLMGELLRPKGF